MFTFTPLAGARSNSSASISILEFDAGIKILVDVGWDSLFAVDALKELERQVATISVILLTHATLSHLGAYAHCCKNIPSFVRIPVYATTPVISLGRTLLQDLYACTPLAFSTLPRSLLALPNGAARGSVLVEEQDILLPPPSSEEIIEYFSLIHDLKYSQPHSPVSVSPSTSLAGLTITAYSAGHTLGGTIWHIQHGSESVVYAVDWNQARENILTGAAWLGGATAAGTQVIEQLSRPTALICSSRRAENVALAGGWRKRDEMLLDLIRGTLQDGGNVLIPCDSSARVLELVFMLDRAWSMDSTKDTPSSLRRANLYWASRTCAATAQYSRSMLEWMNESVGEMGPSPSNISVQQTEQAQPFDFKHCKLLERESQISRAVTGEGSKVFIASDSSMDWGFSKDLVRHLGIDNRNMIVLTDEVFAKGKAASGSLLGKLWELMSAARGSQDVQKARSTIVSCNDMPFQFSDPRTSALNSGDASVYQQYLANQKQVANTITSSLNADSERPTEAIEDASSSSSSSSEESDTEQQGKALNVSSTVTHSKHKIGLTNEELGVNILVRRKDVHDYDVRGKRGRERMFPFVATRRRNDDFGDLIRAEDYLRAEERNEDDADTNGPATNGLNALGQKRKWNDKDVAAVPVRSGLPDDTNKRRKLRQNGYTKNQVAGTNNATANIDDQDESEESDYEPAEPTLKGPTKLYYTHQKMLLNFKIAAVDFSGIHDKRALQMLIPLIRPRKLIFIGGSESETNSLAVDCRKMLDLYDSTSSSMNTADISTPAVGTTIDASVDTNAWTIRLSQDLYKQLHWQKFRGLGIVTVSGRLEVSKPEDASTEESAAKRPKLLEHKDHDLSKRKMHLLTEEVAPILKEIPANIMATSRLASQFLHVGDLKLQELRTILSSMGHTAEFKGEGTLFIDGLVAIRKTGVGRIEIESGGPLVPSAVAKQSTTSFAKVKRKIYDGLAIVAAR